ncbi:MAX gene-associated protein-like isoform X2 [Leucoraja erinacea]|uniref:MAX gene-associated protein-like isoform X2 n=1 Tax=Leucoraja erinaceus TaxID=7782 RepID=UPI00245501CC|nr:MAX gene-associated protein-like isoform X2 [Leucoraja erinacea]
MFLRAGGMPGRRRKRCGTWSSVDIKRRRETSRIRREQETEQEKIERIKDQRERAQNTRNKTLREREQHRIMPRRGIKRNAGLTRKDATRHQVSEKTRREQERQQIRAERLRVQRERMRHISNEERPILSHVCEKLWNIPHLTLKPLQENSKGNNSGTVTACKLNRCRNSTTIEGVSKHPETCNCTPDLSKSTKTEGPQFLLIPLQSNTTARPAQNLQRPGAKLFQYPNGQIVELVPLPNSGPVTQPNLHQKVTPAVWNPGSLSGNRLPTPTKFCSVASSPSIVTPCRKGIIPQRGPHSTTVVKPAFVALKETSTPQPISAGVSEVPVKTTSQRTFVAVNGVGQTINAWHLVPHQPLVLSLLQLPQGPINMTNVFITAGPSLTLVNQSSGLQSFEKTGFEKTANQNNKSEDKLIEPGLEKIHVADSELIETTVTKGVQDEDHVNADPSSEVKQETDAFPSPPSASEVDDEDHTMDHQNALEHPTPAVVSKFDSTSSEEAMDIETVEELSEKINIARLIASASRLTSKSNILKCLPNIYSTNPSNVASSEYYAEPFKIIVKEEPPDDYEYNHVANPVILDCDGLKCKDEKEFSDSEGWDGGTKCDLQNKTMNKSSINEVDGTSSAAAKQPLISPIGVAKCLQNIYSTNPSIVASSECHEEPFKIIIKEEPPDDYEYNHAAHPVILDCDGLKCKEEKDFLNSEGWYRGTNCELQNKTTSISSINEVNAISSAVTKPPLISPVGVFKCLPNIYSTNPSSVASSEYHEEPFKIIVKEEPPDDYEDNHVVNPVILDCDGLKCKKEKEFLGTEGWDGETNCNLQNKTRNNSSINEVDATLSAVTKQPLISPIGVDKAKMLSVESTKVPAVYFEPCSFSNGTVKLSELPQQLLSSCQWKRGPIPIALQSPNSSKKPTHSSSSAENSQVENAHSKSVCSRHKESSSASEKNVNKTSTSTVSNNPTASHGTPPEKTSGEGFRFCKMKYTEKAFNSGNWGTPQDALQSHLVEHVPQDPSNPIHPSGNYQMCTSAWPSNLNRRKQNFGSLLADPQESEEEFEQLEEQLLEDLSHLDRKVIMHPLLEGAGLKPNSLLSTVNLKRLGVVISPSSASIVRPAQRTFLVLSPIKQVQEPLEVSFVSRTGKTNDFTKLKGWKQKLVQQSGSSTSKQTETSAKPEYSLKNSSVFSSDKLDEYLEKEEKIIEQRAALSVSKTSKVVCQISKDSKQIEMTSGPVSDSKDQKSANNAKVASTPTTSAAKTNLRLSFAPTRLPGLSKKQIELMNLENGALWVVKPWTCITEERADASLVPLVTAQENSKGNNSGTVTACKLNRCRNSATIEGSGNHLSTPIKSYSVASSPSSVTLCPEGIIPKRGRPRSTPVVKPACVALQTSTPQSISAVVSEVPVKTTSQAKLVTVNGIGQTINAGHLVRLQPVGFPLLQLPREQKNILNATITAGKSLKLANQSAGSQSFERAGSEKTANQNNKSEEKLIETGLEEIHVAGSELIETTVSQDVPDEDHVNADPLPEVKQATDAFPSTPSVREADDELEDDSMDHQNAFEHPTPAELVDHSYTSEKHIVEEENEKSVLDNSTRTGKGSSVDKDSSRSNREVVDKETEEMPSMEEKNWLQDEQVEVEMEDKKCWFEASTFNVPAKREEDMLKNPENDELDFHQRLLQYENFMDSDKDTDSQSDLEDGDSQSDAEKIDIERMFDSTSSEEAVDIETVEELSEKINIARLIASASRLTSKSKCHFHNPYLTNKSDEEEEGDIKSKPKHIAHLSKEAKDRLDALVVYLTAHTVNERRRRSKKRHLFEKLKSTLAIRGEEKVSKYFILKQAFAEIQNLQNYSDCLSAGKSIQTRRRDFLIRKVSLLTGKTEEVILKKLEYNCAKQRALDVEKRTSMQEGDDASEQHSVSWNTASISSMNVLQKVAMDLQIQKPPNAMMLCSGQDLMSEGGRARPLILTRKHSSTPQSSTSSIPLTTGSLLMTPQDHVPTLKGPLISGQTPFFTAEGHPSENQSKGDGVSGTSIADDEVSSFMMPRIVNVMSLATGESLLLNLEEANDSCALVPQPRDFSVKGRKHTSQQLNPMTSKKPSLPIIKSNSQSSGQFTAPDESEAMSFLVSSEATESKCAQQQIQQTADSHSMNADNNAELPKALDLSGLPDGTAVSCARHSWNQDLVPGESTSVTETILGDKLELQVMSGRLQACSKDKAGGQSDRDAELSASQLLKPLLKANGSATGDMMDTEGYEPFTSLLNELAFLNHHFSDEESPDTSMSDHHTLGFIGSGNQGDSMDELLINGPVRLMDIDAVDSTTALKQVEGRESGGSTSPLVLQLEGEDLNVEQLLADEMPVDSQSELDNCTLDFEGDFTSGSNSSVNVSPPPLIHMKTTSSSTNTEIPSSSDLLWRPMPKLAPFGLIKGSGKGESSDQTESESEISPKSSKPMPALARISSPQQTSMEGPEVASEEHNNFKMTT